MSYEKGTIYHGLKLGAFCGGGAYGEVYVCTDISGRQLAVKIISKVKLGDGWERELRGVSNYRRITEDAPNLLQIYHVEEDADTFFYTMEAADSVSSDSYRADTLAERLKNGPLPQNDMFKILRAIFDGIKTIHEAGFAHRDIKPDNIIFVKRQPKLSDIGLLSSLSSTYTQLAGTLDFLPPEERSSDSGTDRKSRQKNDLYAFGKVIYCSVTGCSPQDFPTVPAELPLTPELKFFLRLAFRLCNKDVRLRLDSLEKTEAELVLIERKLLYGETWRDKLGYAFQHTWLTFSAGLAGFIAWARKHWIFMGLALIVFSSLIWLALPEKKTDNKDSAKVDITKVKSKEYVFQDGKLSMTIPSDWIVLSQETIQKRLQEFPSSERLKEHFTEEQLKHMVSSLEPNAEMIFCGVENGVGSGITVSMVKPEEGSMEEIVRAFHETPDDELKLDMINLLTIQHKVPVKIFSVKRGQTAKHFSLETFYEIPKSSQVVHVTILANDRLYYISYARASFEKTVDGDPREMFNEILSTLKITD